MYDLFCLALEEYGIKKVNLTFDEAFRNQSIDKIDLNERSKNCLKRGKFLTIGEVLDNKEKLKNTSGCGEKSIKAINSSIIRTYLLGMSENEAKTWIAKTILASN